jgi:hypothetical protein
MHLGIWLGHANDCPSRQADLPSSSCAYASGQKRHDRSDDPIGGLLQDAGALPSARAFASTGEQQSTPGTDFVLSAATSLQNTNAPSTIRGVIKSVKKVFGVSDPQTSELFPPTRLAGHLYLG